MIIMVHSKTYCDKVKCNGCGAIQWVEIDETEQCLACGDTGKLMDIQGEDNCYQYVKEQVL